MKYSEIQLIARTLRYLRLFLHAAHFQLVDIFLIAKEYY